MEDIANKLKSMEREEFMEVGRKVLARDSNTDKKAKELERIVKESQALLQKQTAELEVAPLTALF